MVSNYPTDALAAKADRASVGIILTQATLVNSHTTYSLSQVGVAFFPQSYIELVHYSSKVVHYSSSLNRRLKSSIIRVRLPTIVRGQAIDVMSNISR